MKQFWIAVGWVFLTTGNFGDAYLIGELYLGPYLPQRSVRADERAYNSVAACTGARVPVSCKEGR